MVSKLRGISGPFTNYIATIELISNERCFGILFDFMSMKIKVTICHEDIEEVTKITPK
jgi:hypothetical protein